MPTPVEISSAYGRWVYELEWTITTAGAVVPNADGTTTTDPEVNVTRTGVGTYRVDIRGNFFKVLQAQANYRHSAASSVQAQVTAIGLGSGTPLATGEAVTTVTVITGASNAVPAAADQAVGIINLQVIFIKNKI
jgi:hypothetical protein